MMLRQQTVYKVNAINLGDKTLNWLQIIKSSQQHVWRCCYGYKRTSLRVNAFKLWIYHKAKRSITVKSKIKESRKLSML